MTDGPSKFSEVEPLPIDEAPPGSEAAAAIRFIDRHREDFRITARTWYLWDGTRWKHDSLLMVYTRAAKLCREISMENYDPAKPKDSKVFASASFRANVISLAGDFEYIKVADDQWDSNRDLFNTPGGTLDISGPTAKLRPHNPADLLTRITSVTPNTTQDIPIWEKFIDEITLQDKALADFLQRLAGYSIQFGNPAQILAFLFGSGRNGKGVYIKTIAAIFGDYHVNTGPETFEWHRDSRHTQELAKLEHARLVTVTETQEGKGWNEQRIKAVTGGDPITARMMRQNDKTFDVSFSLVISGNHKPTIRTPDEAIKARIILVPFNAFFPPEKRDPDLEVKLKKEHPGILAWMLKGLEQVKLSGLNPPPIVTAATQEYFAEEDSFTMWLNDNTTPSTEYESAQLLFDNWKEWAEKTNDKFGKFDSQRDFKKRMEDKGHPAAIRAINGKPGQRVILRIKLKDDM